ncbi:MAG: hypothetical protein GY796_22990 [Chloroflexi bacterium]|nr:hypothetical protein [Chloroflexota bacterium]
MINDDTIVNATKKDIQAAFAEAKRNGRSLIELAACLLGQKLSLAGREQVEATLQELQKPLKVEIAFWKHAVNQGEDVDANHKRLRAKQKELAELLFVSGQNAKTKTARIHVDRQTLACLDRRDFPERTMLVVGKYRIVIGNTRPFSSARVFAPSQSLSDLPKSRIPQYVYRFVFD